MNKLEESNTPLPTISIIFPTRNRQEFLPTFLERIYNLKYPKKLISIFTIINDSLDDSEKILYQFKKQYEHEYNQIYIKRVNLDTPTYDSNRYAIITPKIIQNNGIQKVVPQNDTHKVYKNLAKHRNSLLSKADGDFIFSIDTDIFCPLDILTKLLAHNTDYVSAFICNGKIVEKLNGARAHDFSNAMYYDPTTNKHTHYPFDNTKGMVECSNSGAVALISKKAYKSGAKYDGHVLGEDFPFSQDLISRGFTLYCDTSMKCYHAMDIDLLELYKNVNWTY